MTDNFVFLSLKHCKYSNYHFPSESMRVYTLNNKNNNFLTIFPPSHYCLGTAPVNSPSVWNMLIQRCLYNTCLHIVFLLIVHGEFLFSCISIFYLVHSHPRSCISLMFCLLTCCLVTLSWISWDPCIRCVSFNEMNIYIKPIEIHFFVHEIYDLLHVIMFSGRENVCLYKTHRCFCIHATFLHVCLFKLPLKYNQIVVASLYFKKLESKRFVKGLCFN